MKKPIYESTITFGNIVSLAGFLLTMGAGIVYNERRMSKLEAFEVYQAQQIAEIKNEVKDIAANNISLVRSIDKLGVIIDKK